MDSGSRFSIVESDSDEEFAAVTSSTHRNQGKVLEPSINVEKPKVTKPSIGKLSTARSGRFLITEDDPMESRSPELLPANENGRFTIEESHDDSGDTDSMDTKKASAGSSPLAPTTNLSRETSVNSEQNSMSPSGGSSERSTASPPLVVETSTKFGQKQKAAPATKGAKCTNQQQRLYHEVKRISAQNHKLHELLQKLVVPLPASTACQKRAKFLSLAGEMHSTANSLFTENASLRKRNAVLVNELKDAKEEIEALKVELQNIRGKN